VDRLLPPRRLAVYWGVKVFTEHRIGNYGVETDFYWKYGPAARDLLHGRIAIENYDSKGLGYPAAVALVSLFGLEIFRAAQLLGLLSAVAAGALMYRLHRSLLGPGVALASLFLLLCNHNFLINTYEVGTDMFLFAIALGSIGLLLAARIPAPGRSSRRTAGRLGVLDPVQRPLPLAGRLGAPAARADGRRPGRRSASEAGIWTAGFVAAALPVLIINAVHTGNSVDEFELHQRRLLGVRRGELGQVLLRERPANRIVRGQS